MSFDVEAPGSRGERGQPLSSFAMVVMDRAVEVAYERLYERSATFATPQGRTEAEQQMSVYDVLHALDGLMGEFVAGVAAGQNGGRRQS